MVEKYLPGHDYRLLVIGDKLIAAARRDPPLVIGDGVHTVRELVDIVNSDPRRCDGHATSLTKIRFDDIALARLAEQGYNADIGAAARRPRRPAQQRQPEHRRHRHRRHRRRPSGTGRRAPSPRRRPSASTSAASTSSATPCSSRSKSKAAASSKSMPRPACACTSTRRSARAAPVGEAIVEHDVPRWRQRPHSGRRRRRHQRQDHHQPPDRPHLRKQRPARRHDQHRRRLYRRPAHRHRRLQRPEERAQRAAASRTSTPPSSKPRAAACCAKAWASTCCDVAVITNIGIGDHLGLNYITTVDELAVVKRVIVENVAPNGTAVLNAADPVVAAMAHHCPGHSHLLRPATA